jgi:hypothetical protein
MAVRRMTVRRAVVLTGLGVAAGRVGVTVMASTLGGVPWPGVPTLLRIMGVAAVSAPLGAAVVAAEGRLSGAVSSGARR